MTNSCVACGQALASGASQCSACGEVQEPVESTMVRKLELLDGKWAIESELGHGGMGTVHLATDVELERKVAIKMLAPALKREPEIIARFEREAKMLARLEHPNMVPVYAVGRKDGLPFIVMKALEGTTLSTHLRHHGRLPLGEVLSIARQLCAGLGFLHGRGVIHRDIKPGNIFIGPDGHVTLLDLGVAHDSNQSMTRSGLLIGTPRYMSPEQIVKGSGRIDHRSDLYALATVLFELLSGAPVFDGESDFSVMRAHTDTEPPDVSTLTPDVPAPVGQVLKRALAKSPEERYASAEELLVALETAAQPTLAAGTHTVPPTLQRPRPAGPTPAPVSAARARPATPRPVSGVGAQPPSQRQEVPSALRPQPPSTGRPTPVSAAPVRTSPSGAGTPIPALPESDASLIQAAGLARSRGRAGLWVGALVALAVLGLGGVLAVRGGQGEEVPPPPAASAPPAPAPAGTAGALTPAPAPAARAETAPLPAPSAPAAAPAQPPGGEVVAAAGRAPEAQEPPAPAPARQVRPERRPARTRHPEARVERSSADPSEVRVLTTHAGASSWAWLDVDGIRQGTTPAILRLAPGKYQVRLSRDGYKTLTRELVVTSGEPMRLTVELQQ